jgi:hypothetical protein
MSIHIIFFLAISHYLLTDIHSCPCKGKIVFYLSIFVCFYNKFEVVDRLCQVRIVLSLTLFVLNVISLSKTFCENFSH